MTHKTAISVHEMYVNTSNWDGKYASQYELSYWASWPASMQFTIEALPRTRADRVKAKAHSLPLQRYQEQELTVSRPRQTVYHCSSTKNKSWKSQGQGTQFTIEARPRTRADRVKAKAHSLPLKRDQEQELTVSRPRQTVYHCSSTKNKSWQSQGQGRQFQR